jgi:hypothetical protein
LRKLVRFLSLGDPKLTPRLLELYYRLSSLLFDRSIPLLHSLLP